MDGVATLDEKTQAVPEARIANEPDARKVVEQLREADRPRSRKRAKVQGMLDGNPPYNPGTLRSKGQAHRTNLNLREGEGMVDSAKTPYYDLVFEVPQFAQVYCEYGDNDQRNFEWGQSMGKRYHDMLDCWTGMDFHFQLHQWQMCVYGAGPLCWRDARDWRSQAIKAGQVLVPDDAPANLEELETLVRPRSITPGDLYQSIKNEKAAKTAGWNVKIVKQAIVDAAPDSPSVLNDWEYYQAQIRAGDVTWNAKSKRIFVCDLFQKEFDGKISHFILLDSDSVISQRTGYRREEDFLFKKIGRFDCFDQIICPFFYDVGTGEWHSVKGLGPKIYDFCEVSNRLTGEMIDGARIGSGITLEAADANALLQTQIVHIGGGVVIQPGYKAVQSRIAESLQGPLAVKRDLQSTLQSNTGQYRQRVSEENQEPTLGQAQLNAQQQAVLGKGAVNRYYKTLDCWHKETLRRALAMGIKLFKTHKQKTPDDYSTTMSESERGALKFIQGCVTDGVPLEALDMEYICSIKATRAIGYGSAQMQEMVTGGLMQLLPMLDEEGRNNVLRRRTALLVGQANVDAIVKPFEQADVPNDQVWAATMENNALREMGGDIIITPKQDHVVHFGEHLNDVQQHAQQVGGGQNGGDPSDPMKLLIHLEQAGPHMNAHLLHVQGDPTRKDMVGQMRQALVALGKLTDELKQQLTEAMQAQAQQQPGQGPDPEAAAKIMKVVGDLKLKQAKNEGDMQLKAQKQDQQLRLKDLQAAHNMRLKTASATADQMLQTATAAPPAPPAPPAAPVPLYPAAPL